jgi:hypothetical protein
MAELTSQEGASVVLLLLLSKQPLPCIPPLNTACTRVRESKWVASNILVRTKARRHTPSHTHNVHIQPTDTVRKGVSKEFRRWAATGLRMKRAF